jgi:hypothetical protein
MICHPTQPIGYSGRQHTDQKMNRDSVSNSRSVSDHELTKAMRAAIMGLREGHHV